MKILELTRGDNSKVYVNADKVVIIQRKMYYGGLRNPEPQLKTEIVLCDDCELSVKEEPATVAMMCGAIQVPKDTGEWDIMPEILGEEIEEER